MIPSLFSNGFQLDIDISIIRDIWKYKEHMLNPAFIPKLMKNWFNKMGFDM